jgi:hypothetical protein
MPGDMREMTLYVAAGVDGPQIVAKIEETATKPFQAEMATSMQPLGTLKFDWRQLVVALLRPVVMTTIKSTLAPTIAAQLMEENTKQELIRLLQRGGADELVGEVLESAVNAALDKLGLE